MMARLLLFAPWTADDAALWNSRWMARQTARLSACETALLDGDRAVREGLETALDDQRLIVEWTIEELPEALREHLARLVTATTFALLAGERAKPALQRSASAAADALVAWLLDNTPEGSYLGLHAFAEQLVDRMVVSR